MTDIERTAPDTIRMERLLDANTETVWRWFIEPELRKQWFADGGFDLQVGGKAKLIFDHDNLSDGDVSYPADLIQFKGATLVETIITCDPPNHFAISWHQGKEGTVRFELYAVDGRTRLVLTHEGITGPGPLADFGGGWHAHLAVLAARLSGRNVPNFWVLHQESKAVVAEQLR